MVLFDTTNDLIVLRVTVAYIHGPVILAYNYNTI